MSTTATRRSTQIVTMGFPDRGEENLMRQTSRCKNFQPNMFNKTKCQNCFRTREAHDLGDDDGSNKPKKALQCGYLFVAPGIDFDNPMSRNRKWQRRCFILYENGELCYALDYDPNTIPQGVVNMYQCTKVFNADKLTGHPFSMGIVTSDETTYVRAETREEKDNWYETLIEYPDINKEAERQKKKKRGVFPMLAKDSEKPQRIEDEQAEAKPDVPPSSDDPLSEIESLERDDELGTDIPLTTARDTTDIYTASSKAARKEKSNLRRSHSALEHRPEKYDKKQTVRRTPSAQTSSTTTETSSSSAKKDREERLNRRHTTTGRSEVKDALRSDEQEVSGKGDALRRPVSDGSSSKYSGSSGMRSRHSESALSQLEAELKGQADSELKSHRESLPAQANSSEPSLHRNNNNVYKDVSPRLSPTQQATTSSSRKSSFSDRSVSPSDSQSTTDSQTKKSQPSKADTNTQNLLSQEELQRLDVPKRTRLKMNKALIEGGETQSPSKRTIERRRHAQERRNRHTLDGSTVPFPISEKKSTPEGTPRLKRSSSDPNLADNEDLKRREIAETFPGLLHLKNGWLMKRDSEQEDWNKHWFVLRDNKLSHFKDSSDENPSNLAGAVDLARCKEATETSASRNYGFQIKMEDDSVHHLGAMTSKIRTNWIQAINKAITTAQKEASPVVLEKEPVNLVQIDTAPVAQEKTTLVLLEKPPPIPQPTSAPDVIPTPLPTQDSIDAPRSNLTIDLTSRHRKSSLDSRISETSSPTEREPAFQERQGSIRSKERRSRRSSRTDDFKLQKSSSRTSMNGRSSSTSSEVFETPPSTPVPNELRIEEPVRRTSTTSTRSERGFRAESPIQILKIEADSLKSQADQQQGDSIPIENSLLRKSFDGYQRQPSLDNENEQKALVSQLETVVKKLSQVELQNQTLHMEVKQARNASDLVKHEKEELHDKLETAAGALDKRSKEFETIQSRFEKLVSDYQESEKELSKARSSLKTERDKAVTMIERLNQQIEIVEGEKKEYRERAKKWEGEMSAQSKTMRQLEKNQEESQEIIKKLLAQREGYKQRLEAKGGDDATGNKEYILKLERHQQELQGVNIQLQTKLQVIEQELEAKSQETPLRLDSESELEAELVDMRMELSERDEQIEQLSEQLEAEFSEKSELQKKYDALLTESAQFVLEGQGDKAPVQSAGDVDLENRLREATAKLESLKMQLTKEATLRQQTENKLSGEASARRGLEEHMQGMEEQLRIATEEKHHTSQIQEDTKNLMELLQGKNKDVEKLQIEMKRMDADRISLMEQISRDKATVDVLKQQLNESEEAKTTLEGDFDCVLHSKVDLEESAKQLTAELATVKSELELLRQASQNASSTESEEEAKKEAARKEVQLLQAQVEKVQSMYTEDMFKKEQLLAEKHELCSELERRFANLQSKLTQKEEALANSDRESGEKMLEVTQQMEQLGQKVERGDRELKRLRQELKSSQDNYDALELKHMQSVEEAKQQQKSQQEQLELMGRRIQDLTSKLGLAERKVRDLTSVEAGWSSFGGGNGDISVSGIHVGAMSGLNTSHNSQSSGIHSQLMEVEQVLGSAESRIQRQHQRANALEGKIDSVEKHMEAIEQAGPSNSISSFDHDVSVNSSSSPSCNSSINQLAGATTIAGKTAETSDTSESSDCPSSDGADGGSKIKILESRLSEMEKKLKQVTHRLVDVTTRELEKRKAYQAKCISENRLKDQVRGLQREVLALRQQTEKVQSHSESSARQTHHLLAQCRQLLMRIQPAKPSQSIGESSTDLPRVSKESTNTANTTDKTITAVPSSAATYHVTDACHTLDKAIDLLNSQLKSLETRKRRSLTELSESVILGLGDLSSLSDGDSPKSPRSCPSSPLFFSTSPPLSPNISPRGSKHTSKVSDKRYGQLFRFPAKGAHGFIGSQALNSGKIQRIRYCHCLLEVDYLNSFLEVISASAIGEVDVLKLLSCHRMIDAEDRDGAIEVMFPGDKNVSGYAAGLSKTIIREAESEFLAMKEPADSYPIIGSNEISAVYAACTTFFTSNWEFSHCLEKDLEVKCDALAQILADETAAKKHESSAETKKGVLKPKEAGYSNPQRIAGKNDSGLGLDSDLAPFAEGIAYEEALRVAMECVSSELVLAEALQCVNSTIEDFVGKIDSEELKCKRVLSLLRSVGIQRFGLIRDAIARQLEATSGLIRQKYWDYLQESDDDVESKMEESKKKKKKETKDTLKNGTPKSSEEEHEGATEKEIALLVLMKAVLSGLGVHLRSELSMLAEGNSNQNNDSTGGLSLDAIGDVVLPSQVIDYSDHVTGTIKENGEDRRQDSVDADGVVGARVSTVESITAEHSRNITLVRERYEAIIKGERTVHEQELIQLRQRLVTADAAVKRLEEDITAMGKGDEGSPSQIDLGSVLAKGQIDLKEAHEQLNIMRADILELVEYHKTKLSQMETGIQAITRCYQMEMEDLHTNYRDKVKEVQDKGRQDLANVRHRYQKGISEMERHHESQTKRLVKEAKEQVNEELLQAQQRNHAQMVEEMERKHRKEMEDKEAEIRLEKEKEDESVTTAISVLKKAYEEELEKEKRMSQESYPKDVETIMKRHREVVTQMNRDWVILSTKFSEQCKENTMLSKALRAMQRSQKEAHEKLQRAQVENRKRVMSLGEELEKIEMDEDEEDDEEEEEEEEDDAEKEKKFKVLEMNLRLRELELEFAQEQIETLRQTAAGGDAGASHQRRTGEEDKAGAGEKPRRSSFTSPPESDGATRPKNRRSLSDLTHMFHKSKKGEKK